MPSIVELRRSVLRGVVQSAIAIALAAVPAVAQTLTWLVKFGSSDIDR